jgi:hypothetical protein
MVATSGSDILGLEELVQVIVLPTEAVAMSDSDILELEDLCYSPRQLPRGRITTPDCAIPWFEGASFC